MGNFSLVGILLTIGVFFALTAIVLSQIDVANPLTGYESSIFSMIIDWIIP